MLLLVAAVSLMAGVWTPAHYATQFRDSPSAAPSRQHWLGTDELGRDRFSRVLYGTRVSLLLAPAAAALSVLMATLLGGLAGYLGGWYEHLAMTITDLFLSMPWLFLLLAVRAMLPLNVSPIASVTVTFLLLGLLGWASSARILCAGARDLRGSEFMLQARASGLRGFRLLVVHVLPNLRPVLFAQFWISVPLFIISEANLGILGLGIAEPMPSWGSLLRELEGFTSLHVEPWKLVPLCLLVLVVSGFQIFFCRQEVPR
jgi:ABC-type dipeptide/oligopeptide/nickel transport system permease subunit